MEEFVNIHCSGETCEDIIDICRAKFKNVQAQGNLGFLYATDELCPGLPFIVSQLREITGIEHWIGSVGVAICSTSQVYYDQLAVSILIGDFPENSFQVIPSFRSVTSSLTKEHRQWIQQEEPYFGIVHGAPEFPGLMPAVEQLSEATSSFLVGGITSSREENLQLAETVGEKTLSGILFSSKIQVATNLCQACTPIGPIHTITDCEKNMIKSLDGRNALDLFREDLIQLPEHQFEYAAGYIHTAIPIPESDTGDYLVRDLSGINAERGWIVINRMVEKGEQLMFVRRNPQAAQESLRSMLDKMLQRLPSKAKGGVYFPCVSRSAQLFGSQRKELQLIQEILGDIPLTGFFSRGEISNSRLYSYAGVLTLFS